MSSTFWEHFWKLAIKKSNLKNCERRRLSLNVLSIIHNIEHAHQKAFTGHYGTNWRDTIMDNGHAAVKSLMIRCNWIYLESVEGVLLRWQPLDPDANVTHGGVNLKRRLEKWRTASGACGCAVAARIQTNLVIHRNVSLLIDGIYRRYMSEESASWTHTHKG